MLANIDIGCNIAHFWFVLLFIRGFLFSFSGWCVPWCVGHAFWIPDCQMAAQFLEDNCPLRSPGKHGSKAERNPKKIMLDTNQNLESMEVLPQAEKTTGRIQNRRWQFTCCAWFVCGSVKRKIYRNKSNYREIKAAFDDQWWLRSLCQLSWPYWTWTS